MYPQRGFSQHNVKLKPDTKPDIKEHSGELGWVLAACLRSTHRLEVHPPALHSKTKKAQHFGDQNLGAGVGGGPRAQCWGLGKLTKKILVLPVYLRGVCLSPPL